MIVQVRKVIVRTAECSIVRRVYAGVYTTLLKYALLVV